MSQTYLATDELSSRIKYDSRTIRERLKDSVLLEGVHYIRPFGGRKISLFGKRSKRTWGLPIPMHSLSPWQMGVFAMASIQTRKETGTLIIDFYHHGQRCREQTASRIPRLTENVSAKS
jgi:phage protein U